LLPNGRRALYNLEHLRMLVETVEAGSFSACARKMGKVQSAVSQGIASLEVDLDVELFSRTTRKPTLTVDGARVLQFARSILRQVEDLNAAAHAIHRGEEALVRIALDNSLALPRLTEICSGFSEKFPTTILELYSVATFDIGQLIKSGRADLGIAYIMNDFDKEIEQCFIGNLRFVSVCSANHPLAKMTQISMSDLIPYRQILSRGQDEAEVTTFLKFSTQAWYANDIHTVRSMVSKGQGWSYVPAYFADDWITAGDVVQMQMSFDHKPWNMGIDLLAPKGELKGPATRWVFDELKSLLG